MTMNDKKKNIDIEEFKYLIDSRNLSSKEKLAEKNAILKARLERFKSRSEFEILSLKLLQLKYQMEAYINKREWNVEPAFPKFLSQYIDTIYEFRKEFAEDLSIKPITLSHIINKHREPKDVFLYRLIVHSQVVYKNITKFDKDLWPKVYYRDKVCQFMKSTAKFKSENNKVSPKIIMADK